MVQNDVKIYNDLENNPLQIKTNSDIGSNEEVKIRFLSAQEEWAGGISLIHTSPQQYNIWHCSYNTIFPTELPSDTERIWTLSLTRTTSVKIVIHCNDVEVLNFELSDTTCTEEESWRSNWNKEIEKIEFTTYNQGCQ